LYVDSNGRGASLGINRGVRDLSRFRFNDNVSSLNIKSGKWEVCEHANFQGRCEIIDASTGKLNGIRLNDNISSIRPVGDTRPSTGRPGKGDRDGDRSRDRDSRRDGPGDGDAGRPRRPRSGDSATVRSRSAPDALAGGPGTVPSLPDTTLPNRQRRATPSFSPPDPVSTTVGERQARRDAARGQDLRREANRAPRADAPRGRPVAEQPQRSQVRVERTRVDPARAPRPEAVRARPQQQRQRVEQATRQQAPRALPQTPAMRSQAPVRAQAAPARPVRTPAQAAPQARAPERAAPAPAPAPQPKVRARPNPRSPEGMRERRNGRVGNNQN
jgi:hypothetical protein